MPAKVTSYTNAMPFGAVQHINPIWAKTDAETKYVYRACVLGLVDGAYLTYARPKPAALIKMRVNPCACEQ